MNVIIAPEDNVSFRSKTSVQKWKYVFLRKVSCEKELGIYALNCKEIIYLIKVVVLMNIVIDIEICYEKLIKGFIMNIIADCNVESNKEYRMVYDKGKCVKLSPSIIN